MGKMNIMRVLDTNFYLYKPQCSEVWILHCPPSWVGKSIAIDVIPIFDSHRYTKRHLSNDTSVVSHHTNLA